MSSRYVIVTDGQTEDRRKQSQYRAMH